MGDSTTHRRTDRTRAAAHENEAVTRPVAQQSVLNRYRLIDLAGSGATAAVYRARDLRSGDPVAVKLVPDRDGLGERARREIALMDRLRHRAICRLLDWGRDAGALVLVLEFVPGRPLNLRWREPRDRPRRTLDALVQVLQGLAHAHARGVVHRDVTPRNVLVDRYGDARLIDFGVAAGAGDTELTVASDVVGTVAYMAPEQARGEPATPAADVWAAAMVAYHGLAGRHPLAGHSRRGMLRKVAEGRVPPPRRAIRGVAPELERVLCAALDADPSARPRALELAAALSAVPITAGPAPTRASGRGFRGALGRHAAARQARA